MPIQLSRLFESTKDHYEARLVAGEKGMNKVLSWAHIMEDIHAVHFIRGSELILTTCMDATNPDKEQWLLEFVEKLRSYHACGLVVSTGYYIDEIPPSIIERCDELGFPIITIPWQVHLVDIVRDFCNRIFEAEQNEESVTKAFQNAIFAPGDREGYQPFLAARGYRPETAYCVLTLREQGVLFSDKEQAERFDAAIRNRLNRLSARYHVFRHHDRFIVIVCGLAHRQEAGEIADILARAFAQKFPGQLRVGIGPTVSHVDQIHKTYKRSLLALRFAELGGDSIVQFELMGLYRMLLSTDDTDLLREMLGETLGKLIEYDQKHGSDNMKILRLYLQNNFSVQQVSAQTFMHRNTVNYRVRKIKEILGTDLESMEEKLRCLLAFYIYDIL